MIGSLFKARNKSITAIACTLVFMHHSLKADAPEKKRQRRTPSIAHLVEAENSESVTLKTSAASIAPEANPAEAQQPTEQPAIPVTTTSSPVVSQLQQQTADAEKRTTEQAKMPAPEQTPAKKNIPTTASTPTQEPQMPATVQDDENDFIEFHFENADLQNLVTQVQAIYNVTFISDDSITPSAGGSAQPIAGKKISFKTQKPLTRKQAWNLFLTFLDMADLAVVPESIPNFYRIMSRTSAKKAPIPLFIGTDAKDLPGNDGIIRYVYFVENADLEVLKKLVPSLSSTAAADLQILAQLKAMIITDKAYNIKVMLKIIKELDKVTMPQAMSILKLYNVDASDMQKLLNNVIQGTTEPTVGPRPLFQPRKQGSTFFPEGTRIIAEPRTNSLILLGAQDAIAKIEEFARKFDKEEDAPYTPVRVHTLKYARANVIADIMTKAVAYAPESEAAKAGGVRAGDKYLRAMTFTPDNEGNRLIIRGDEDDYLKVKDAIEALDVPQPQIALEVLILNLRDEKNKELGAQIRSKKPGIAGLVGNKFTYQTSGFAGQGIVENENGPGATRLLGNLLKLATGLPSGNTVVSLGTSDIWAVFRVLDTISTTNVVSNPYIITTNKTPAQVSVGETRRVQQATVVGVSATSSYGDEPAKLTVDITPQINSDGMIVLDLKVDLQEFTADATGQLTDGNKSTKTVITQTVVADKEVIALGGLVRNRRNKTVTKVPALADAPIIGWLFKNRSDQMVKENLLILVSSRIVAPFEEQTNEFTDKHIGDYQRDLKSTTHAVDKRDPINRWFFETKKNSTDKAIDDFIFKRQNKAVAKAERKGQRKRKGKNKKTTPENNEMLLAQELRARQNAALLAQQHAVIPVQQNNAPAMPAQEPMKVAEITSIPRTKKSRSKPSVSQLLSDNQGTAAC